MHQKALNLPCNSYPFLSAAWMCVGAGRLVMVANIIDPAHEQRWTEYVSKHRCDSQSRGSVYDSKAGARILASA